MAVLLKCSRFLRLSPAHIQFSPYSVAPAARTGLVLGVYSEENKQGFQLTADAEKYDKISEGKLCHSLKFVDGNLKAGKSFVFWDLDKQYQAVAVVGLGKKCKGFNSVELVDDDKETVRIAAAAGCRALKEVGVNTICIDPLGDAQAAAEGGTLGLWKFQECKTKHECPPAISLFTPTDCPNQNDILMWNAGVVRANAQNQARRLADMPANLMTPTIFAKNVEEMFTGLDVSVQVHDEQWIKCQNMHAFLAVAKGSSEPPKFLELTYTKGCAEDGPFVLVGKGVTFDSGGISLKPAKGMDLMRGDMGGAAACVAVLKALASCDVQANVKVLIPLCENMPSGSAVKPGDVVKAMNGKTICIDNTDAEGRLILADALTYSGNFKPKWILDMATLTGAIQIALGSAAAGVFTNSNKLYALLEKAGGKTGDRVWRLPLWKEYTKDMTDHVAYDVNNVGKGRGGGSCTAAAFLKEFIPECVDWVHVDIAAVASPSGTNAYLGKGMTGRPTRTIIEFIESQSRIVQ